MWDNPKVLSSYTPWQWLEKMHALSQFINCQELEELQTVGPTGLRLAAPCTQSKQKTIAWGRAAGWCRGGAKGLDASCAPTELGEALMQHNPNWNQWEPTIKPLNPGPSNISISFFNFGWICQTEGWNICNLAFLLPFLLLWTPILNPPPSPLKTLYSENSKHM